MGIADEVKYLEETYNSVMEDNRAWREECSKLMDKETESKETIRRLTIENNDLKKDLCILKIQLDAVKHREDMVRGANATLVESKKNLESMLDPSWSSCSACKKPVEIENLKNRIKNLESKLADRDTRVSQLREIIATVRSENASIRVETQIWRGKWEKLFCYCQSKCPHVSLRPALDKEAVLNDLEELLQEYEKKIGDSQKYYEFSTVIRGTIIEIKQGDFDLPR